MSYANAVKSNLRGSTKPKLSMLRKPKRETTVMEVKSFFIRHPLAILGLRDDVDAHIDDFCICMGYDCGLHDDVNCPYNK
jgi:hypothetical protein